MLVRLSPLPSHEFGLRKSPSFSHTCWILSVSVIISETRATAPNTFNLSLAVWQSQTPPTVAGPPARILSSSFERSESLSLLAYESGL